jgi:hypothetical protein
MNKLRARGIYEDGFGAQTANDKYLKHERFSALHFPP